MAFRRLQTVFNSCKRLIITAKFTVSSEKYIPHYQLLRCRKNTLSCEVQQVNCSTASSVVTCCGARGRVELEPHITFSSSALSASLLSSWLDLVSQPYSLWLGFPQPLAGWCWGRWLSGSWSWLVRCYDACCCTASSSNGCNCVPTFCDGILAALIAAATNWQPEL